MVHTYVLVPYHSLNITNSRVYQLFNEFKDKKATNVYEVAEKREFYIF